MFFLDLQVVRNPPAVAVTCRARQQSLSNAGQNLQKGDRSKARIYHSGHAATFSGLASPAARRAVVLASTLRDDRCTRGCSRCTGTPEARDVIFRRLLQTKRGVSNFQQERGSSPLPFHGGGVEFPDLATVHGAGVVSEAAAAERRLFFSSDSAFK